ncbi:MAG: hypothetical protein O3B01_25510 [Planctomycetota bacterium]|nr:hypothetical protein [Planctomycetota bacterium]MDA1141936.1 hypothetical protein [Planctomycetota bacterium]
MKIKYSKHKKTNLVALQARSPKGSRDEPSWTWIVAIAVVLIAAAIAMIVFFGTAGDSILLENV